MTNKCKNCSKFISKDKKFCSIKCENESNSKEELEIRCPVCDKLIYKGKSKNKKNRKTCSMKCRDILKKTKKWETRICKVCGDKFEARKVTKKEICSDECRKEWASIPENKEFRLKRTKESINEKYGVDSIFELKYIQEQIHKKQGNKTDKENVDMVAKVRATKKQKYGDENYNNMEKNKETKLKNHGNENYNNREQFSKTMDGRWKEVTKKRDQTNLKKYGVKSLFEKKQIRDMGKEAIKEKYGTESYLSSEKFKEDIREKQERKIISKLKDVNITLLEPYSTARTKKYGTKYIQYKFKCNDCNYEFTSGLDSGKIPVCRKCNPIINTTKPHIRIKEFLNQNKIFYHENYRKLISPLEVDFYLPDYNASIEVNGNFWHSDVGGGKNKKYHLHKTIECNKKGIKLIHIFEDELKLKKNIVLSRLSNMLNLSKNKIYGRECIIKEVNIVGKTEFLDKNHIQGNCTDKIRLGLYYNDMLVSLMTFGKLRKVTGNNVKEGNYELIRFCSLINHTIIGSFSKLLKHFVKTYSPIIITTYADIRWSGIDELKTVYNKNGFKFVHKSSPSYHYIFKKEYLNRQHRFNYRKSVLKDKLETFDPKLTEWENMQLNEYDRIWDCGSLKFELNCKNYLGM